MKALFSSVIALGAVGMTACIPPIPNLTPKLYLHPVRSPMGSGPQEAAITATSTGIHSGSISFQLPDGEACTGPWEPVPQNRSDAGLADAWDRVYGQGYFT